MISRQNTKTAHSNDQKTHFCHFEVPDGQNHDFGHLNELFRYFEHLRLQNVKNRDFSHLRAQNCKNGVFDHLNGLFWYFDEKSFTC